MTCSRVVSALMLLGALSSSAVSQGTSVLTRPLRTQFRTVAAPVPRRAVTPTATTSRPVATWKSSSVTSSFRPAATGISGGSVARPLQGGSVFGRGAVRPVAGTRKKPVPAKAPAPAKPSAPAKARRAQAPASKPPATSASSRGAGKRSDTAAAKSSSGKRRSKKPLADLKRRTIDDPKTPKHIRGHLQRERNRVGNNPYRWRNPPGYQGGHPRSKPFHSHGDAGALKWELAKDNRSNGIIMMKRKRAAAAKKSAALPKSSTKKSSTKARPAKKSPPRK